MRYFIGLSADAVILSRAAALDDQPGMLEVEQDVYDAAKINGSTFKDGVLADYTPPVIAPYVEPTIPDIISDRQCFQQLAMVGKVSQDEALAAVTVGALPKAVADGIAALPADRQFGARMLLCGATSFERLHPMVPVFLSFFGLNGTTDRDALWTAAAAL